MEKNICKRSGNVRDICLKKMSVNNFVIQKINTSQKESNLLKNDNKKSDNNGNTLNVNPNICNIRNLIYYRKKQIPSCTEEDYFNNKLPNELILMIFQFLSMKDLVQSTMVCKRWHELTYAEILWNNLNLFRKTLYETTLHNILSKGVQVLSLSQAKIHVPFVIQEMNNNNIDNVYTYKLKYLDLSMAMISVDNLSQLLSKCKHLKKLSLESCTLDTACCKEISNCIEISVLNLAMCEGLDLKGIIFILNLRSLTELNIAWCSLDKQQVDIICKRLPLTMMRLNISGCKENMNDFSKCILSVISGDLKQITRINRLLLVIKRNVSDETSFGLEDGIISYLSDLILSCPKMMELDLSDNTSLTEDIFSILINLQNLEHLSLSRCFNINSLSRLNLDLMPYFEYLDIFDIQLKSVPNKLKINKFLFSSIARPTLKDQKTIWGLYVKS